MIVHLSVECKYFIPLAVVLRPPAALSYLRLDIDP